MLRAFFFFFFFQMKAPRLNNTGKEETRERNAHIAQRKSSARVRSRAFPGVATGRARSETTGRARFMPLCRYGGRHESPRKTADTQRMCAAELGIRTRVNGRKCELIRSLRRTLPLSSARSWTREEEKNPEREQTLRCAAHHLGSMPLETRRPLRDLSRARGASRR